MPTLTPVRCIGIFSADVSSVDAKGWRMVLLANGVLLLRSGKQKCAAAPSVQPRGVSRSFESSH